MLLWWDDTITDLIKKIKLIKMGILQNQKYLDKKVPFCGTWIQKINIQNIWFVCAT